MTLPAPITDGPVPPRPLPIHVEPVPWPVVVRTILAAGVFGGGAAWLIARRWER